jgi:hypothetical protein
MLGNSLPSLATLKEIFRKAAPWSLLEIERSAGHGYDGAAIEWLNCTATKQKRSVSGVTPT